MLRIIRISRGVCIRLEAQLCIGKASVLNILRPVRKLQQKQREVFTVHFSDLKKGMVPAENLRTRDEKLVLIRGITLNESLIPSIQRLADGKTIEGPVHIINPIAK